MFVMHKSLSELDSQGCYGLYLEASKYLGYA